MRALTVDTWLLDDDTEDGIEIELCATVHYQWQRAEPDVGIMHDYPEVLGVSACIQPFGEIFFEHDERYEDQIFEACDRDIDDGH